MTNNPRINQLISFIGILVVILLMVFRKEPDPVFKISKPKVIETRIENKEEDIIGLMNQIAIDRGVIASINTQLNKLKVDLEFSKGRKDTTQIIKLQDIIIHAQDTTINRYAVMDQRKDSVIINQRYIINSKDTLLAVKDHEIKRIKKQRNISLLINAIQTGIIIIK